MIIEMLLDLIFNLFTFLSGPISIPDLPAEALNYISQFFDYLEAGAGIFANYSPFGYVMTLFGVVLAVDVGIKLYHFIMWVLKKIPVLGIE